jgi:hypothetical protein
MSGRTKTIILIAFLIASPILSVTGLRSQTVQRARHQRNAPPAIESFTPSTFALGLCPLFPEYYIVKLDVKASDPDGGGLTYHYLVSGGRIVGQGSRVDWDLRKTSGQQRVTVDVSDRRGGKSSSVLTINVIEPLSCDFPCPTISVSCPSHTTEGEVGDFVASISGSDRDLRRSYSWHVINGKVVGRRKKNEVRIRATGSPSDEITVTVSIRGLDPSCNHQASCASRIEKRALSRSEK